MKLRPEIEWFAGIMEQKLQENDDKGGWSECTTDYLLGRLRDEFDELGQVFIKLGQDAIEHKGISFGTVNQFCAECADVANFAMMLADNALKSLKRGED